MQPIQPNKIASVTNACLYLYPYPTKISAAVESVKAWLANARL